MNRTLNNSTAIVKGKIMKSENTLTKIKTSGDKLEKPVSGTGEWAADYANIQTGCKNDCLYCYAKSRAMRFKWATPVTWKEAKIRPHDVNRSYRKSDGTIMFPSTHDIVEENLDDCITVLKKILDAGNSVLIVSKPRLSCIRRLCKEFADHKQRILFRFTIGSAHTPTLKYWEPHAPAFAERLKCLKHAFDQGYATSVSCEPMLDANISRVVDKVRPYVTDAVWIGKANRLRGMISLNCPCDETAHEYAEKLIAMQSDAAILAIYDQYKDDPLIKWKDSIKDVAGLKRPHEKGLDI